MYMTELELQQLLQRNPALRVRDMGRPANRQSDTGPEASRKAQADSGQAAPSPASHGAEASSESEAQILLFTWAACHTGEYPELGLLHHIPNGGRRDKATAGRLKAEGVKAGVPDICLPVPRGPYHGMYLEMKYGGNKTTKNQDLWITQLSRQGYHVIVSYSWESAAESILEYLALKKEEKSHHGNHHRISAPGNE